MASIFSKIVAGEIPCYKVAEDTDHLAFLDISPLVKGHVLVIPKKETDYLFDLGEKEYLSLWAFSKKVERSVLACIPCERVGVVVMGLEVPHAHIHLIPIRTMDDMNFSRAKLSLPSEEMQSIAASIREHYNKQ